MISAYLNCYKIPELRKRILFTLGILALYRLVSFIPCPGVNPSELAKLLGSLGGGQGQGGLLDMMTMFSGGAMEKFAIGALGIMPYISASIILQLMTPVIPYLERMMREGEAGRQKHNQTMRIRLYRAPGRRAMMLIVMIMEAPLPMPCSVIISPIHITSMAPAVSEMTVITMNPSP